MPFVRAENRAGLEIRRKPLFTVHSGVNSNLKMQFTVHSRVNSDLKILFTVHSSEQSELFTLPEIWKNKFFCKIFKVKLDFFWAYKH